MKMNKAPKQKKAAHGIVAMAQKPLKHAKKAAAGLSFKAPAGKPQLKFDPAKKPKSVTTDRGVFGIK